MITRIPKIAPNKIPGLSKRKNPTIAPEIIQRKDSIQSPQYYPN